MEPINAARRAREVLTEELETYGWARDVGKDEEIEFGGETLGEATWTGITYTSDLKRHRHTSRGLTQAGGSAASGEHQGSTKPVRVEATLHLKHQGHG